MITVAICDDEQYFINNVRKSVEQYLSVRNFEFQIFQFGDGESLLLSKEDFNVILMDLKLPGISGMEVIEKLRDQEKRSQVIFITSYQEYAIQAFCVDAVHYLLKPISDETLFQALDRSILRIGNSDRKTLSITKGTCTEIVFFHDILYCESINHRIYVHTKTATFDYLGTLSKLQGQLDSRFFRCHKSYIVNMDQIVSRQGEFATVVGGRKVLISRRKQQDFSQKLLTIARRELL